MRPSAFSHRYVSGVIMRFAVNLSFHYQDRSLYKRFAAAAADGFDGVEFLFPYAHDADELASALRRFGLEQALFNMPPGDWDAGDRGIGADPSRRSEFEESIEPALHYAKILRCRRLHCMAGVLPVDASEDVRHAWLETYLANVDAVARRAADHGIEILIEPLNRHDVPRYLFSRSDDVARIVRELGHENVRLQLDLYHVQIEEGDLTRRIESHADVTGHVQVAGVPNRNEPDLGEMAIGHCLDRLERVGFQGWIGCEYRPVRTTAEGLGWMGPYRTACMGERR